MQPKHLTRAAILAAIIIAGFILCWEYFWRSKGYDITYNDDKALWARKRAEVYQPKDKSTVFIGSSRIKFDLDIPTWESITGEKAVQLALVGTSPLLVLRDLAEDDRYKGKLVIDVTEVLFFSQNPAFHQSAREATEFYHRQTPAEQFSSRLNFGLESGFVFLEERRFALNALLNEIPLNNRPGVFQFPAFPKGFEWTTLERQTYMSDMFLSDPKAVKRQTEIWSMLIMGDKTPPVDGDALKSILNQVREDVERIRSRGGEVIFVRTPSSGPMGEGEQKVYPRQKYWETMLQYVQAEGIHFLDYPETKELVCPEWSHLSREQAVDYTRHFIKVLAGKGWFKKQSTKIVNF